MNKLIRFWNKLSKREKTIYRILSYIAMLLAITTAILLLNDRIKQNSKQQEKLPDNIEIGN